ncbi:hypothetical protein [Paenibacillus amylolyticus]|uniref:hypothetical protein n=1 Tax=Paenibacillus amylolyticus TaxID=1451 RepID=UPI0039B12114
MGSVTKSMKRYAYVSIETYKNVDDKLLDQLLIKVIGEKNVRTILENNVSALKSLKLTKTKLVKGQVDLKTISIEIGALLKENYALFNHGVNFLNDFYLGGIKERVEKNDHIDTAFLDVFTEMIESSRQNYQLVLLFCRHYKNGLHKELIKDVVDKWGDDCENIIIDETKKGLDGSTKLEKKIEDEQNLLLKESVEMMDDKTKLVAERIFSSDTITKYNGFEEMLPLADQITEWMNSLSHLIKKNSKENLSREVTHEEKLREFEQLDKKMKDQEKEKVGLHKQYKKQITSLINENNQLKKSNSQLQEKIEVQLKEHGKVTQMIGELRKEKETVINEKNVLERKNATNDKEKVKLENIIRIGIKKEFDKELSHALQEKNNEIRTLQKEFDDKTLNYLSLENVHNEVLRTMNLMENENKELYDIINEKKKSQTLNIIDKPIESDDEEIDDISLESLENLVNFNNQPY